MSYAKVDSSHLNPVA